ncbi:signal peptidase I [Myxococcota bacterium]|nr:signal peptidase I [Myxococcota bacterium]
MRARPLTFALLLPPLLALLSARRVVDDSMSPSIRAGDLVLLGPGRAAPGDVVCLSDPGDPSRAVLRRVIAVEGQAVQVGRGVARVDGEAMRVREMGPFGEGAARSEQNRYLIQESARSPALEDQVWDVPEGHHFLLADDRDGALDSRAWGPVPAELGCGRVWLRVGPADLWRGPWALWAQDGPWIPPSQDPARADGSR